ncbi:MAG: hypothetical protein GX130_10290 [Candidatus Hydrogenedens sp.]|jgi:hypothetical protein|nr:hypothetical protein [Candidatus Hydrogenedens sp.]
MPALFTKWETIHVFDKFGDAIFMKAFLEHERIPVRLKREMMAWFLGLFTASGKSPIGVVMQVPRASVERARGLVENFAPDDEEQDSTQES